MLPKRCFAILFCCALSVHAQQVFINEFHYDNTGTDENEGFEIAGPAGTLLSDYEVVLYNGGSGMPYGGTLRLSGTIPNQAGGAGAVWFAVTGIQNDRDGMVLVYWPTATVVQRISYEGSFTAVGGVADGQVLPDIGVAESSSTPATHSLQLTGTGTQLSHFKWTAPRSASRGSLNAGQTILTAPACSLTATASHISRSDNGTPTVSTDDTFTFDVTVSHPQSGSSWQSNVPASDATLTGTYGIAKTYGPLPVNQSPKSIHFSDSQDVACNTSVMVAAPDIPPAIITHPADLTVNVGQVAIFSVVASGTTPAYQWRRNEVPIDGATSAHLTISSAQPEDSGSYTVAVSNSAGSVVSDPAVLSVYVVPAIIQQPLDTTTLQGQVVLLVSTAEGSGTLAWQWRKDGVSIPGATTSNYCIPSAQPWHSGNYSAVITNGSNSATSVEAAVKVSPFPYNVWQGLVAYYPLNPTQPGQDLGPVAQHATNQGTEAVEDSWGRSDGARRLVASESDGMATATGAFFHSQPNFTWTAWVKTSGTYSSASTRIISTEGPDGSGQAGFGLYANSNGKFGAGLNWGGGAQGFESAAAYPANVWRHLAATYDGSRLRLYVDGTQAGSRLYSGVTQTSDSPLYFGKYRTNADGSTGGYFDGWLDEVRFYNRVLSTADLMQLRTSDDGVDLDNDGLGDAWEARHGFSAALNEGGGDADGDGMTNRDEYLTGSHPLSAASNFHTPQLAEVPGLNVLNLTWHGSPARNYAVQVSPDLSTWSTLATLPGLAGPTSLVVEAPVRPSRHYYKVVVVP